MIWRKSQEKLMIQTRLSFIKTIKTLFWLNSRFWKLKAKLLKARTSFLPNWLPLIKFSNKKQATSLKTIFMAGGAEKSIKVIETLKNDQIKPETKFLTTSIQISKLNSSISFVKKERFHLGRKRKLSAEAKNMHSLAKTRKPHPKTPLGYKKIYLLDMSVRSSDTISKTQPHFQRTRYQSNPKK